jgi:hypothetical protein
MVLLEAEKLMKDDVGAEAEVELVLVGIRVVGVLTPVELLERTLDELLDGPADELLEEVVCQLEDILTVP